MNIALLGYGKMGKLIEQIALEKGHKIILKVDSKTKEIDFTNVDVAIDFSLPSTAYTNIKKAIENSVPVVSGTTGWLDKIDEIKQLCIERKGAFIYSSNFSIGVNLFFEINKYLAKIMENTQGYSADIHEIHHTQKLDAPSGTAITLAEGLIESNKYYQNWEFESGDKNKLSITAEREGDVPGTHVINYKSAIDSIEIKHTAHNRNGFATGAVVAASWLVGKQGVFDMSDVLSIK
ncbi:MAG: 4-hydroxy-tetrahydrodipicolinate reductase [Flavobacteriaceae bacterium]|nr:4-hydroxy-tetrahydrodipicolinate reductase [Flavobacteriaceae bacterium]